MRGRVSDPLQPLRAARIPNAPGFAGGWLPQHINFPTCIKIPYGLRGTLIRPEPKGKPLHCWLLAETSTRYNRDHKPAQLYFWRVFC